MPNSAKDLPSHDSSETHTNIAEFAIPRAKRFNTSKGEGLWLLSFGDLSLILISFFILLLSFSSVSQKKADIMREAVQSKATSAAQAKKDSLTAVSKKIETEIKRLKLDKSAEVVFDDQGIAIEFKDGLLFDAGSASSNPKFQTVVGQVMQVIATTPNQYQLKIEGHTDDIPIKSPQFGSNWELASARSIALMHQFAQRGVKEDRMSIVSYGQTRPKRPISGLKGSELVAARASNRRVVIRIEPR